jgi:hypothetical protein
VSHSGKKNLMIGLRGTGKTTFLAALWHVVESENLEGTLSLEKLEGDRSYLNDIRNNWLRCTQTTRTQVGTENFVSMKLKEVDGDLTTEMIFPDMSGETFQHQWGKRQWSKSYQERLKDISGVLLFIHPEKVEEPYSILEVEQIVGTSKNVDQSQDNSSRESWEPSKASTQTKLIELLQFLLLEPNLKKGFQLAVIVSAWDLLEDLQITPQEWLSKRLPMLYQFLLANPEIFQLRIFGLSAQGGDPLKESEKLQEMDNPAERIKIVYNNPSHDGEELTKSHDITEPIRWLM